MSKTSEAAWRDLYERMAPVLVVLALMSAVSAVGWSWQNSRADHRQDQQRISDGEASAASQQRLIDCFDDFASQLAGGLPPVRQATAARDAALAEALDANAKAANLLKSALVKTLDKTVTAEDVRAVVLAYDEYQAASKALRRANEKLEQVRADNPYPPPPSEFCNPD